jgi:hypothetical protein
MEGNNNLKTEVQNDNLSIRTNKMFLIDGETGSKVGGRKPTPITYKDQLINNNPCVICSVTTKGRTIDFIIDKDDEEKVKQRNWFCVSDAHYIGCNVNIGEDRKVLHLHNFIMNKFTFDGKGQKETVDHINRNGLDNRKCNLRIISQTLQNINRRKRERTAKLPEGIRELPKHIWYIKPTGNHGERFAIEMKSENIIRKTTSAKSVSIQDKLKQALEIRDKIYNQFPYLKQV